MSASVVVKKLSAGHGARVLFSDLELTLAEGDVVGLVGANGAGKSTLLRTIAGIVAPESGSIVLSPPSATIGYLPQEPERRTDESVRDYVLRRTGVAHAQAELDAAVSRAPWIGRLTCGRGVEVSRGEQSCRCSPIALNICGPCKPRPGAWGVDFMASTYSTISTLLAKYGIGGAKQTRQYSVDRWRKRSLLEVGAPKAQHDQQRSADC